MMNMGRKSARNGHSEWVHKCDVFTRRFRFMRFILVVFLFVIGVPTYAEPGFAPGVVDHVPTKIEKTKGNKIHSESICKQQNGQWLSDNGNGYCVLPYPDSGKACTSSKDCVGHCIAPNTEEPITSGTCQMNDDPDDCGRPHFEKGKVIYFNCD